MAVREGTGKQFRGRSKHIVSIKLRLYERLAPLFINRLVGVASNMADGQGTCRSR